jgi:hypothetical protein
LIFPTADAWLRMAAVFLVESSTDGKSANAGGY